MKASRSGWGWTMAVVACALIAGQAWGATAVYDNGWSGGGGTGGAPTEGDHVVIREGILSWTDTLPDTVASWVQEDGYTNTVTFETKYPDIGTFTNFTITGDCVISNGVWTHLDGNTDTAAPWIPYTRLRVHVGGDFVLHSNATINADGRGYSNTRGPGYGGQDAGSGHGGRSPAATSKTYGNYAEPTDPGSGSHGPGTKGGGAVYLTVAGNSQVDGVISVDGAIGSIDTDRHGSAGSIYLRTGFLSGSGIIRADVLGEKAPGNSDLGAGGRVAVILTNAVATFAAFDDAGGKTTAYGNTSSGQLLRRTAAGTVYRVDGAGTRTLLVVNRGDNRPNVNVTTVIPDASLGTNVWNLDRIVVEDLGTLDVGTGSTLNLTGNDVSCSSTNTAGYLRLSGGTFNLPEVGGTNVLTVRTNVFLLVNGTNTLTGNITVEAGGRITVDGNLTAEAYKMDLTINGNLTVETNASVYALGLGFSPAGGPGAGAHGGMGNDTSGKTYGSILDPVNWGSGRQGTAGGGAIRLTVTGVTRLDGTMTADGVRGEDVTTSSVPGRSGAGGSISLRTGTLTGNGAISADAPNGYELNQLGGGGRVAVVLTDTGATIASFEAAGGAITAYGSRHSTLNNRTAPGTVYRQDSTGRRAVIDNAGAQPPSTRVTHVPASGTDLAAQYVFNDDLSAVTLVVTNGGRMTVTTNVTAYGLIVATTNETLNLGVSGTVLTVTEMNVNGTPYIKGGTYTTNDWNGFTAPINVSGSGEILLEPPPPKGTLIMMR